MARIRSIHPGLFTDDAYMALTFAARELLKGIWCEADDQGVFEWKPRTLKARIMPADNVDLDELLAELVAGRFVTCFAVHGSDYGAVRNFIKFQRPKKPVKRYSLPPQFRTWVGYPGDGSEPDAPSQADSSEPESKSDHASPEPVLHPFPTSGEKSRQMEDGGGRGGSVAKEATGATPPGEGNLDKAYYDFGKRVLGARAGGVLTKLKQAKGGNPRLAHAILMQAAEASDPMEYVQGAIRRNAADGQPFDYSTQGTIL